MHCPFVGCSFTSTVFSTFTAHRSWFHQFSTFHNFRPDLVVNCHSQTSINDEQDYLDGLASPDLLVPEPEFNPAQKSVQQRFASLFLRLRAVPHVSQSAFQKIVDDLFDISECAG